MENITENVGIKWIQIFSWYDITKPNAQEIENEIIEAKKEKIEWSDWKSIISKFADCCKTREIEYHNLITTVGRSVIAQRLVGTNTYTLNLDYGALGTGTTAPANADTILETEQYRNTVASQTNSNNIAYLTWFYSSTETNGNFREFGNVIDGWAGANTGQLFTHVAVAWNKSALESLTVDCSYEIL